MGFEISNKEGVWLETDGTMARGPLPDPRPSGSMDSGLRAVMSALQAGIPLPGGQALVARGPEVMTVDLLTGAVLSTRTAAPGLSCRVLSTDDDGLAVCYQYSVKNPAMTRRLPRARSVAAHGEDLRGHDGSRLRRGRARS